MAEPQADALLAAYLAGHDATCPVCAYNLRGLAASTCPECGVAIELGIHCSEARLREWIFGLVGWCLGGGTAAFFIIMFLAAWIRSGDLPRQLEPLWAIGGGLVIGATGLTLWVRCLAPFRKLSLNRRRLWALASWLVAPAWMPVFFWIVF